MPSGAFRALRPIILASSSPRRRELLGSLGIDFTIKVVDGSEPAPTLEDDPAAYAMRAAQAKAEAVARAAGPETPDAVVLGSDTIVVLHEEHGPPAATKPSPCCCTSRAGRIPYTRGAASSGCRLVGKAGRNCFTTPPT